MIGSNEPHSPTAKTEDTVFTETDDVNGDTYLDVWTNGVGDLHILIGSTVDGPPNRIVYIRDGESLGKAILKAMWL